MRALVLEKPAPIETDPLLLCDLPLPQISEEEVLIRIRACGVCRTDLHIVRRRFRITFASHSWSPDSVSGRRGGRKGKRPVSGGARVGSLVKSGVREVPLLPGRKRKFV